MLGSLSALPVACLLLNLETVDDGGQLTQDFVGFPVVLKLGSDQVGEVAERLRRIKDLDNTVSSTNVELTRSATYILHDPNSFFRLAHKLIFSGLNLCPSLLA
jgi:hypothetical protein